jgi:hypothetical protein
VQCSAVQCSAVQCSALQCTALHCSGWEACGPPWDASVPGRCTGRQHRGPRATGPRDQGPRAARGQGDSVIPLWKPFVKLLFSTAGEWFPVGIFSSADPPGCVQCSAVQCSAVHGSALHCSAVQCSAVQCRPAFYCPTRRPVSPGCIFLIRRRTLLHSAVQCSATSYMYVLKECSMNSVQLTGAGGQRPPALRVR